MRNLSIVKWFRNISIARKLYFTVGIMALLIAVELATLLFAIHTLSSVRTLVGAEGLWSKAQKDAVYHLQKYGHSHQESDYQSYLHFLKVPQGDHITRVELGKKNPDMKRAFEGFRQGRVHPDDIDGALKLMTRFSNIDYIQRAITVWVKGDTMIAELQALGDRLHAETISANPSPEAIARMLKELETVNEKLTKLEDEFSYTLGEGSRWLANLILKLLFGLVLSVEISGLSLTILVSRSISRGLNEIISTAGKISKGDYTVRAKAYSKDEIGILADSFNEMTDKLQQNITKLRQSEEDLGKSKDLAEQAVVIKDHFLANMSHEIRTPMNAIIGFTDLLENSPLDEDQKKFVQAIKISGQNLTTIINDILDYSKIKSGMIVLEQIPFSVRKILDALYVLLHQKAAEKNLDFRFSVDKGIPDQIVGDPTRLTQVLSNLADNALKFTAKGSVSIDVVLKEATDSRVTLAFNVRDTGIGVPPEKQALIFERFTQERAETNRKYGGTGLGLSIVKSLVELQRGSTMLVSEVGKGSVFTVTLGYDKVPASSAIGDAAPEAPEEEQRPAMRILYAEDHPLNQMLVQHFSKRFGFQTEIVENGKIAVDRMREKEYDLILMDMQMPEMDGYEATTIIRTELKNDIPIIALTAHAMSGEKEKCLALGMNDFVTKPFEPQNLYEKIMAFYKP